VLLDCDWLYVTEQEPPARVQLDEGANDPDTRLLVQLTVPVDVVAAPLLVSVTVAVQVDEPLTGMVTGAQTTTVDVDRLVIVTVVDPELTSWVASPP